MSYEEDPRFKQWAEHVRDTLIPMITDSAVTVSIAPGIDADVKYAVELGYSIIYDKPIILVVPPGREIGAHLRRVADEIVYADITTRAGRDEFQTALSHMLPDESQKE